jgi:hypothetical protein
MKIAVDVSALAASNHAEGTDQCLCADYGDGDKQDSDHKKRAKEHLSSNTIDLTLTRFRCGSFNSHGKFPSLGIGQLVIL